MSHDPLVILQESALRQIVDEAMARVKTDMLAAIREAYQESKAVQPTEELLTVDELCAFLGVSRSVWYRKKTMYPELASLRRGKRWPGLKVKAVIDALR